MRYLKLMSYFMNCNHLYIGLLYILFGLIGGSLGYSLSLIIRTEILLPGFTLCSSFQYNSIITFHGLFMIFFMIMPILIGGFGNFLLPLLLCCSDMLFPRLNALSLWLLYSSLFIMSIAMVVEGGVNVGWTFYIPLSIINSSSVDLLFFSLHIAGLSSLSGSINFIVTLISSSLSILQSLLFVPLFPWSIFFTSILLILSLPVLAGLISMIIADRHFNTSFLILWEEGM